MKLPDYESTSIQRLLVFLLMSSLLLTTGCNGCFQQTAQKKKKKEEVKDPFESQTPVTLPGNYPIDPEEKKKLEEDAKNDDKKRSLLNRMDPAMRNQTKLGHWVSVDFLAIANNFNADGYLETSCVGSTLRPRLIEGTDYFVETSRPFNLVKGDWKKLETSVFLPRRDGKASSATINYILNNGGSLPAINVAHPHNLLEDYQFHIVLLSSRSDSLKYFSFLDCIRLPKGETSLGEEPRFYSIIPTTAGNPIPLPGISLNWTTIAYLIWDDLDPDELSTSQQQALVDWLHFGGQIIFSGPDCLDRLQSSFLADYLPGQFEESITLAKEDVEELNKNWSIAGTMNKSEKRNLAIQENSPLPAIRFKPHVDASFIEGSSGLALERRIGRGRVVATAFSLNNRQMKSWRSFTSFVHNALLRKPSRSFTVTQAMHLLTSEYKHDRTSIYDPLTGSTLRYISRDLAGEEKASRQLHFEDLAEDYSNLTPAQRAEMDGRGYYGSRSDYILPRTGLSRNKNDYFHYGGFQSARQSGVAGWNDSSGIAAEARETLKKAARITPPSASFVMKMLGLYLLVLVPVNWLLFRLIGKVEWAWIAAPIIAIVGAFLVVRYASLDIGFVRSVSHVGVLELQGDFERGHLTDYAALYTSLTTPYDVELDNLSGQSLPFANVTPSTFKRSEDTKKVELARTTSMDLRNFLVRSNSTGLLHTEMMLDVGGAFSYTEESGDSSIENGSLVNVKDAAVVRKNSAGNLEFAWIGELEAGDESKLQFEPVEGGVASVWSNVETLAGNAKFAESIWKDLGLGSNEKVQIEELALAPELQSDWKALEEILNDKMASRTSAVVSRSMLASAISEINGSGASLAGVFDCVASNLLMGPGEVRLIGHTSEQLDQSKYKPGATQANHNLLVVVHLKHADLPACGPDSNAVSDFDRGRSNLNQEQENFIGENVIDATESEDE